MLTVILFQELTASKVAFRWRGTK